MFDGVYGFKNGDRCLDYLTTYVFKWIIGII